LAVAFGIAYGGATFFGVSFALGAFVAGLVVGQSDVGHEAGEQVVPLRDAFAVLFFVSVGMLIRPEFVLAEPGRILVVSAIIIVGKAVAAFVIVLLLRGGMYTALVVATSLAQIGEFSFILATLGLSLNLLPDEGYNLILAGALVSITVNPLLFRGVSMVQSRLATQPSGTAAAIAVEPSTVRHD
jgi:CPA2 family monovalent cation:H+ antiporter-2